MAKTKTSSKVKDRYNAKAYDEIKVRVSKGSKEVIQDYAESQGQSVNGFINAAIDEKMGKASQQPVEALNLNEKAGVVSLHHEAIRVAQEAAQSVGETVSQFIERAMETQAKRDRSSLALGINPVTGEKLDKEG